MEDMLSITDRIKVKTFVSKLRKSGIYWDEFHGLISGYGFKAFADDFPEGTQLKITAEIILPEDQKEIA
jgi:hypothetical protein